MSVGRHIIADLYGSQHLDDLAFLKQLLEDSVHAARATLLHTSLHHFTPYSGVTGVAILCESHISLHTWPEYGYAAFDIFMCGRADPYRALALIEQRLKPDRVVVHELARATALGGGHTARASEIEAETEAAP